MTGCARVEFVPFAADSPEARAPCVVTAADGSRVLRLPVPLTFCLDPPKYTEAERAPEEQTEDIDPPWWWGACWRGG